MPFERNFGSRKEKGGQTNPFWGEGVRALEEGKNFPCRGGGPTLPVRADGPENPSLPWGGILDGPYISQKKKREEKERVIQASMTAEQRPVLGFAISSGKKKEQFPSQVSPKK